MKKSILLEVIICLLVLLFVYTGVSKIINHASVLTNLQKHPFPKPLLPAISILLPTIELSISILLVLPSTRKLGLYASAVLMTLFTAYVAYIVFIIAAKDIPCTCGGIIKQMTWWHHLYFNISYTLLALIGIRLNRQNIRISQPSIS